MSTFGSDQKGMYELPLDSDRESRQTDVPRKEYPVLPKSLIVKYAVWFCHFRWIVIICLMTYWILGYIPGFFRLLTLHPDTKWALVTAGILTVLNIGYLFHIRYIRRKESFDESIINVWIQIIIDFILLTIVVHFIGSVETPVSFAYLFHIVLACIFFPRPQSLKVVLFASVLYVSCVVAEESGILPIHGIFTDSGLHTLIRHTSRVPAVNVLSVLIIWCIVWYLTSFLTEMVRARENELVRSYWLIEKNLKEKTDHMLRTTHELKSSFAAISANVQLLLNGHCGVFPDEVTSVLLRIAARCNRLTNEIQEMLQLSNVRSSRNGVLQWTTLDLADLLQWSIAQVQPLVYERDVHIEKTIESVHVHTVEDYGKMLLVNLLSNAIVYSHRGGKVCVQCVCMPDGVPVVRIEDTGIGIDKEKLSHIFEEYYRTDEAVMHNKGSSGLGLTIVRDVAHILNIRVIVESLQHIGTNVIVQFPPAGIEGG